MGNILELSDISKKFKTGAGVKNINLNIIKGKIIGLIGDNGAGKTTTIKLIFNELKSDSGKIIYFDSDNSEEINLQRMYFFPDQSNFVTDFKLKSYLEYHCQLYGLSVKEAKEKTLKLLNDLQLLQYKKNTLNALSAGMKKRVLLAMALIKKYDVIFFDEPTSNLDVGTRNELLKLIQMLNEKENITIVITSHVISELQEIINYLIVMDNGEIVYDAEFNNKTESINKIYLNVKKDNKLNLEGLFYDKK